MITSTIKVKRGDTWTLPFEWTDSEGDPIDLTGSTAKLQLKKNRITQPILTVSSDTGELIIEGSAGVVTLIVSPEVTSDLPIGIYQADLKITFSDYTVTSTEIFFVTIESGITQ